MRQAAAKGDAGARRPGEEEAGTGSEPLLRC